VKSTPLGLGGVSVLTLPGLTFLAVCTRKGNCETGIKISSHRIVLGTWRSTGCAAWRGWRVPVLTLPTDATQHGRDECDVVLGSEVKERKLVTIG
jgi:hypothetical protein